MMKDKTASSIKRGIIANAIVRIALVFLLTGSLLFASAGSIKYWRGWLFLALLFSLTMITLTFLAVRDPLLLEKRMRTGEKEKVQKVYLRISLILVIIIFLIPGLDYRFNWSEVPVLVTIISAAVMTLGYAMFIYVLMVNRFASRIIEIQEGQKLVDSGPYSVVRHPMYFAVLLIYGAVPLVLGSYRGLIPVIIIPFILVLRIQNEERVLMDGLNGYREYMERVRYRLIPYVW